MMMMIVMMVMMYYESLPRDGTDSGIVLGGLLRADGKV